MHMFTCASVASIKTDTSVSQLLWWLSASSQPPGITGAGLGCLSGCAPDAKFISSWNR